MPKKEKSLEEIAESVEKAVIMPSYPDLEETTKRFLNIAKVYDPEAEVKYIGGHSKRRIIEFEIDNHTYTIDLCESQKEKNKVSPGLFNKASNRFAAVTHRDVDMLRLYLQIPGSKVTKRYLKRYPMEGIKKQNL
ncbi:MAG: hypothetical protein KJ767_02945 [Nanoarchaeota archaeon]|nr:hypothetical protein [Nanoarchaeota archaeon]